MKESKLPRKLLPTHSDIFPFLDEIRKKDNEQSPIFQ